MTAGQPLMTGTGDTTKTHQPLLAGSADTTNTGQPLMTGAGDTAGAGLLLRVASGDMASAGLPPRVASGDVVSAALPLLAASEDTGRAGLPLLIVGHGTRSAAGVAGFCGLVDRVRGLAGPRLPAVDGGFIELSAPSVAEAVRRMPVAQHPDVVAVPLVLTAAGHGKGDIPAALARERQHQPGLRWRYGRPLGPHPALLDVLAERIDAALGGQPRAGTQVVLVGRGSTDPDGNAEVAKVARLLWEGRGYAGVEFCFVSLAEPSVPAALDKAGRLGAERVVVAPYFLFAGVLPDRVAAQAGEFAAQHLKIDVRVAGVIGDCPELAGLVLERYQEALRGDIRMNCDTCAYRIALPGFGDKVGSPQTPHHHPDDPDDPAAFGHVHAHHR